MSAPEDRERRLSKLNDKHGDKQRRTGVERTTRLKPYDRGSRHNTHVAIEKGAAVAVQDFDADMPDIYPEED